jgi:hypothetical protein
VRDVGSLRGKPNGGPSGFSPVFNPSTHTVSQRHCNLRINTPSKCTRQKNTKWYWVVGLPVSRAGRCTLAEGAPERS